MIVGTRRRMTHQSGQTIFCRSLREARRYDFARHSARRTSSTIWKAGAGGRKHYAAHYAQIEDSPRDRHALRIALGRGAAGICKKSATSTVKPLIRLEKLIDRSSCDGQFCASVRSPCLKTESRVRTTNPEGRRDFSATFRQAQSVPFDVRTAWRRRLMQQASIECLSASTSDS
jgi:hypothetical protein